MVVWAVTSAVGSVGGLITGGLLTTYLSWQYVFFVNVPIGIAVALLAPHALRKSEGRPGRFDVPGAITGTLGLAVLVYGLSNAATSRDGTWHWGDTKTVASLVAGVMLLASFILIEARSTHALMPLRIFRNRNRSGAYLILLCVGTEMFGLFFFVTLFVQNVWGYSALKTGLAYLPTVGTVILMTSFSGQLVRRIGAGPLLLAGSAFAAGGMFWLSRINEHSTYTDGLLGPIMVIAAGLGLLIVPLNLVALSKVNAQNAGLASKLFSVSQQVGGSIGLAVLGTVAWTVVANSARDQIAAAAKAGHSATSTAAIYDHAISIGFSRGFEVCAAIMLIPMIITITMIRSTREDLAGVPHVTPPMIPMGHVVGS